MTTQIYVLILLALAISTLCGFVLIPIIIKFCIKNNLYDLPNVRKVHTNAVPRLGGVCFVPSMLLAYAFAFITFCMMNDMRVTIGLWSCLFLVSILMIYTVGIVDDFVGVKPMTKFIVQIVASSLVAGSGLYVNDLYGLFGIGQVPYWAGIPLTVFILVFIDNAINLIDGIDGLAAGLSILSLLGFLYCFLREELWLYGLLITGLIGVLLAFFYFNVFGSSAKQQKIFMGDSGSLTIGFILGFLFIKFAMNNPDVMPYRSDGLLIAYTLLVVPCFDVVRVILSRLRRRQPLFKADKSHIHHKLIQAGMSAHAALTTIIVLALAIALLNFLMSQAASITVIVVTDIVAYAAFHLVLDRRIAAVRQREAAEG